MEEQISEKQLSHLKWKLQRVVAQLVEQRSPKPQVAGSSPVRPAFIASINNLYARTPGVLF